MPWQTAVADAHLWTWEEVQDHEEKALHLVKYFPTPYGTSLEIQHWIPWSMYYFQVHRAVNASQENVLNINTTHWRILDSLANAFKNILPSRFFPRIFGTLFALNP
jgi:hypothetical protein